MSFIEIPQPEFKQGDLVRVYETGDTFTVWVRMYDIDLKEWFYEDAEHNYNYYANELALAHTNPEPAETIQIPEPKFEEGQLVRVSRMNRIFSVWMRFYDIHNGKWSYEDENRDYECYEDELEPAYTHPDSAETIQIPKPKYGLYTLVKEDVSEGQEWGSVIEVIYSPLKNDWVYTVQYGANDNSPMGYTKLHPEHILKSWQEYKDND